MVALADDAATAVKDCSDKDENADDKRRDDNDKYYGGDDDDEKLVC